MQNDDGDDDGDGDNEDGLSIDNRAGIVVRCQMKPLAPKER